MRHGRLSPIEIAEGALLADVAVIFQLLWLYLPVVGGFFRVLIPVVFTVLVLRRRLQAGRHPHWRGGAGVQLPRLGLHRWAVLGARLQRVADPARQRL